MTKHNPTGDSWINVFGELGQIDAHEDLAVGVNGQDHVLKSDIRYDD